MQKKKTNLVFHIPNDLFKPSAYKTLDGCFTVNKISGVVDTYILKAPIKYNITITNTGDAFLITGNASCDAYTSCSRCLEDVDLKLKANIDAYYLIEAPQTDEENEINEFEILPEDHNIDLGEIIKATFIVDAPTKPLCKKDCKGLCPVCGNNLNKFTCNCKNEIESTNAFSVLKGFKVKE